MHSHESEPHLNGLDEKINVKGAMEEMRRYFERILHDRDRLDAERQLRLDERFEALDKALTLQAEEYKRRLTDLNGEYKRDQSRQTNYVTTEKFEDNLKAEKLAREAALLRVDEKLDDGFRRIAEQFNEYVKRYEQDKRDLDVLLAAQKGAAEAAKQAALEQGRKTNRNIAVVGSVLGLLVFLLNLLPYLQ